MRHYSREEEERIRARTLVREWTAAGLLDPSQGVRLEAELRVDLKRTNDFLRAGLMLFTWLIVAATVWLAVEVLGLDGRTADAVATGVAAVACIGLAEILAGRFRFYRFGVEEALAVAAVALLSFSAAELASEPDYGRFGEASRIVALLVAAAGGLGLYWRFGFVYAAIASMACAGAIPFQMELPQATMHGLAAAILTAVFLVVRSKRLQYKDDYPGDEYGQLQAAALAGVYIVLNLQIGWDAYSRARGLTFGVFYWLTYVTTWVLPVAGLGWGIREKDRVLMDVGLVMALVTLLTNKPYLGWPRHEWDPMLLGVLLAAVAMVVRRWLATGPDGQRFGFTPARLLGKDSAVLTLLTAASTAFQPDASPSVSRSPRDDAAKPFDGGRSGGAGGGAAY
jgi:hypothetical protein